MIGSARDRLCAIGSARVCGSLREPAGACGTVKVYSSYRLDKALSSFTTLKELNVYNQPSTLCLSNVYR